MTEHILVVEDDPIFRSLVEDNLLYEGYSVDAVASGDAALSHIQHSKPDLIVLDLTLPDCDGLELCPRLHQGGKIPIIILSARSQKPDKLRGFNLGADDYITKPTDLEELLARIRVVLRRSHPSLERLTIGRAVVDFQTRRVMRGRKVMKLTNHETKLLRYLAQHRDQVVHRNVLLTEVWGYHNPTVTTRSVDQAILRLRKKVESQPHRPIYILTAHRDGYVFTMAEEPHRSTHRKPTEPSAEG